MPIAKTVESLLARHCIPYDIISHSHSMSCSETAKAAAVSLQQIAKPVILGDEQGYLMVVVPGDGHVDIDRLSRRLGRQLRLVDEGTFAHLFVDCELGAIPPLGPAYGVDTIVDDRVLDQAQVCFVAGDHDELVRVNMESFRLLIEGARHAPFRCTTPVPAETVART